MPAAAFNTDPRNASHGLPCTGHYFWNSSDPNPLTNRGSFAQVQDYTVTAMEQYLMWTKQDPRIVGWHPFHYQVWDR